MASIAKLYWFLDSIAGGFCLEPVLGAPRVGEGEGWGSHGCTGCSAWGETSTADQDCSFPTGNGCREVCSGQTLAPCQPCSYLNIWEYLLGNTQGKWSWPRGKGRSQCQPCAQEGKPLPARAPVQLVEGRLKGKVEREAGSGPGGRRAQLEAGPGTKSHCQRAAWTA